MKSEEMYLSINELHKSWTAFIYAGYFVIISYTFMYFYSV